MNFLEVDFLPYLKAIFFTRSNYLFEEILEFNYQKCTRVHFWTVLESTVSLIIIILVLILFYDCFRNKWQIVLAWVFLNRQCMKIFRTENASDPRSGSFFITMAQLFCQSLSEVISDPNYLEIYLTENIFLRWSG